MPNSIKYNVSTETLALKKGNFWIGTGDVGKGPTNVTGYYNGITPPAGGFTIYLNKETSGPSIYTVSTEAQLVSLTNTIGAQSFTTSGQCLNWFATQTDKMIFNIDYPAIVTDGLVLNLDAGFTPSYPTTATTWYDVSSGGNNGTLTNGPTYSSNGGGSIVFDGVDDTVSVPDNAVLDFTVNLTSEVWINLNLYKDISIVNAKGNGGGQITAYNYLFLGSNTSFYFRFSDGITSQNSPFITKSNLPENTWGHVVGVLDTTAIRLYLNGVEIGTATTRTINPNPNNSPLYISGPTYSLNGKIAISRIYNRALTATEITQNYNAQKSRFGL
jgi:energy-coupling factor transporter ATP-binding protein EcfA2